MSIAEIIINTVAVCEAVGYRECDTRRPIEDQPNGGSDRLFQVPVDSIVETLARLATSDNIRTATLRVRVAYFVGGGDAGGHANGGDLYNVNIRATEDGLRLAAYLENPETYNSAVTGIRRVIDWRLSESFTGPKSLVMDVTAQVEWEEIFAPAVAA